MVLVVLAAQIVDVAGADQRPPALARDRDDLLVARVLDRERVLLDLEVDVVGAESVHQLVGVRAGQVSLTVDQVLAEARLQAAGERDHTLAVGRELLHVDARLAALVAVQKTDRRELDEVAIPGLVGGQQRQVKTVESPRPAPRVVIDHVHLAADDRLDLMLTAGREQLNRAVHHAVIGKPERGLAERRRSCGERVDLARPVK